MKPNILFITTDQQRFDTIASLGNPDIYTPHLDWLADEGIIFNRAYTDCPVCMPARATIMTGKHASTIGLNANNHSVAPLAENPTLPAILTKNGYQTRAQGKMHFEPMRANYGFEHMELPMDYYHEMQYRGADKGLPKQHGVGENEITPVISTVDEINSLTHWTVKRSIDFLETRDETRPFFLWTSFTKPHPPFDPCANYWALYQNKEVAPPVQGKWSEKVENIPQGFLEPTYSLNNAYRASPEQLKDAKRAYYACITQIDYSLGLLFSRLRELDLLKNTWIIFTSDHGEMLGDHHMAAKTVFLEGAAHIPLIIRPPADPWDEMPLAGKKINSLACLADIMPTLLSIAGIQDQPELDGKNLLDFFDNPQDRPLFGICNDSQFALIDGDLKYLWNGFDGGELLFDLESDPQEKINLLDDPAYLDDLKRLRLGLHQKLLEIKHPAAGAEGLKPHKKAFQGPRGIIKWPGFHSLKVNSDVLH